MENNKKKVMPPARRTSKKTVAKKRVIAVLIAVVLIFGAVAGSTLAWFTDYTDPVVNTFTVGDVDIDLDESTGEEYKMIPGFEIMKDPYVTVRADSEKCYVFVELTEDLGIWDTYQTADHTSYNFSDLLHYEVATSWKPLADHPGVYYQEFEKSETDQVVFVLKRNTIGVDYKITKEMMAMLDAESKYPTLSVKAYAIQYLKNSDTPFEPVEAWDALTQQIQSEIPVG